MKVLINSGEDLLRKTLLRWGYEVVVASDGNQAIGQLTQKDPPKLVILDCEMEGLRGPDICKVLRADPLAPYIYVILLMDKSRQDDLLESLEQGADDYLAKPFDGYELRAKLLVAKRILELQDRLISMRDELLIQATHDSLTGLWNRKASVDALARELARSDRDKKPVGLMLMDLDHFKQINDTYGHLAGDCVLQVVAGKFGSVLRSYDTIGRYGGEEFLIVSPGCDADAILRRAEEIRTSINQEPIATPYGVIPVSLSIGAAVAYGMMQQDQILKLADEALYRAKRAGRNRVELAP